MKTKNLSRLLITLLVMLFSVSSARAGWFDNANHFSAMQNPDGSIHFKLLNVGRENATTAMPYGIDFATIWYSIDTGHKQWWPIIRLTHESDYAHNVTVDFAPNDVQHLLKGTPLYDDPGHLHILNDFVRKKTVVAHKGEKYGMSLPMTEDSEGLSWYLEFDYYLPLSMKDQKNIIFKIDIDEYRYSAQKRNQYGHITQNGTLNSKRTYTLMDYSPATGPSYEFKAPQIITTTIPYDTEDKNAGPNKVAVFFQHNKKIYSYFDDNGKEIIVNDYSGPMYVTASDTLRKQYVFKMKEEVYDDDIHELREVYSTPVDIPAYHKIHFLDVKVEYGFNHLPTTNAVLEWRMENSGDPDVLDSDFFQIERATKSDYSDAEQIGLVQMENTNTYTFIDSTEETKSARASGPVYYRIRRASSAVWGWDNCGEEATFGFSLYQAPFFGPIAPEAERTKEWETSREVKIKARFDVDVDKHIDDNMRVILHKTMILDKDTRTTVDIEIPSSSIIHEVFWNKHEVSIDYADKADVPCVEYEYSLEIDMSNCNLKPMPGGDYIRDVIPKNGDKFKFDAGSKLTSISASQGYFADQVFLQWETEGGIFDDYAIYAKDNGSWKHIATVNELFYNDRGAVGGVLQDYMVVGELDCGGEHNDTIYVSGFRGVNGIVSGRISYADGSGSPDVQVQATLLPDPNRKEAYKGSFSDVCVARGSSALTSVDNLPTSDAYTVSVMLRKSAENNGAAKLKAMNVGFDIEVPNDKLDANIFKTFTETYDGKVVRQYIDSTLVSETSESRKFGETKLEIFGGNGLYYDELRIYNRALSQQEIGKTFNSFIAGNESGLIAYFHFDETKELGRGHYYDNRYLTTEDAPFDLVFSSECDQEKAYSSVHAQDDHQLLQAYTGLDGSYTLGGLSFLEGEIYDIIPTSTKGKFMFNNNPEQQSAQVAMSTDNAVVNSINAVNTASVNFTATVYYNGSTIPVHHANFKINGQLVKDTEGKAIESDASGKVKFNIPTGEITIQAVMEGHKFLYDGFVEINGTNVLNIEKDLVAEFWDDTKVRLTGRIVGGDDEGSKPLYKNLSVNNLGDNLQFVLELEGDNVSHFVYDNVNHDKNVKTRDEEFDHTYTGKEKHITKMNSTLKRVTIHPDPITGEYEVLIYPTRYVVRQASAEGYATLFPTGVTSQTVDISNFHDRDTAVYSLTYHSPISLTYEQMVYGMPKDYLGEKSLKSTKLTQDDVEVPLIITNEENKTIGYTFGYPVFKEKNNYQLRVQAHEDYYYNNNHASAKHSKVVIKGEQLRVHNGLSTSGETFIVSIDEKTGYALLTLEVNNPTFTLTGEDALRLVDMSVKVNGEFIAAKDPLKGYISDIIVEGTNGNGTGTSAGTDVTDDLLEVPVLLDIVRDPQGAGSSAYVDTGTTYSFNFGLNVSLTVGLNLSVSTGTNIETEQGIGAIGPYTGVILTQSSEKKKTVPITSGVNANIHNSYSQSITERISTSSAASAKGIGANADVYIGTIMGAKLDKVNYLSVMDADDVEKLKPAVESGLVKIIAKSTNGNHPYYLVVTQKLALGTAYKEKFAYNQYYIVNTLLPKLLQERNELIYCCSKEEAQLIADKQHKVIYYTSIDPKNANFGLTDCHEMRPSQGAYEEPKSNRIEAYNNLIATWTRFIYNNEETKYSYATKKTDTKGTQIYSVVYGNPITVTENTSNTYGYNVMLGNKLSGSTGNAITDIASKTGGLTSTLITIMKDAFAVGDADAHNGEALPKNGNVDYDNMKFSMTLNLLGTKSKFSVQPVISADVSMTPTTNTSHNVVRGYTLSEGLDSYEDIVVYKEEDKYIDTKGSQLSNSAIWGFDKTNIDGEDATKHKVSNFIFLRKGGATRNPYLPAEKTIFYHEGFVLSPATLKIDNPKVTITKHEISNVPADQAAVFEIILSNESEITDGRKVKANSFAFYQEDATNSKGLKILMDGQPITDGRTFVLAPGDVLKKTIEVYRGSEYDYEDVKLTLMSVDDITTYGSATFSVHYSRAGLPPTLTLPVNNWIMNTLSSKDKEGRYYIPVEIDNINPNENFDHVELQYKLQTQGDDMWVNLCSYYADTAYYEKASGNKVLFEGTKIYNVKFYGENDPIEQRYDVRAVTFYRHGSTFVTASSEIRSGLKDTRVPQLFGAVTPKNGILGVGDYISIPFSEDIAANYLNEKANFEITGYTNAQSLTGSTSLQFAGTEGSMASTAVTRNLHEKSFTIDLMVQPETNSRKMAYFSQGNATEYVELGQDGNKHLYLTIKSAKADAETVTSTEITNTEGWSRVAAVYDYSTGAVRFYQGNKEMTVTPTDPSKIQARLDGVGKLNWGNSVDGKTPYEGRMYEARLWTKALSQAEITNTKEKHLSGFEKNLLSYYPMSEGVGNKAKDKANGATLDLNGQTWNLPRGLAMHVAPGDSLRLNGNKFNATEYNDFTLSFWFRADEAKADTMALLASGRGVANEVNANGRVFFGLANGNVVFQHNGAMAEAVGNYADQNWHQVALSVNRAHNVANLYVDDKLKDQLNASKIGSLSAGEIYLGYTEWTLIGDSTRMEPQTETYPFSGYFDDIVMWNAALPEQYMSEYYNQAPNGEEMALVNHLSFSQRKQNSSGIYETVYNPYNNKVVRDDNGNVKKKTDDDRLILNSDEYASSLTVDQTAPITEKDNLEKLDFSFMGKDNELVINIDRLDKDINKQNIFVTVTDVEDLAGNPMASPLTWVVYVDRNQVRWSDSYVIRDLGLGETDSFRLNVTNTGATTMNYEITDLPEWLTVDKAWGSVGPATDIPLEFKVGNILDAGEHTAIIYITDQNGLSDPLSVTVNVKADEPEWEIEANDKAVSMSIVAQVTIIEEDMNGNKIEYLDTNTADLIGAFVNNKCIGKAHITIENGNPMVYLSARGPVGANIDFVLWRANTGSISILEGADVTVKSDALEGTPEAPIQLHTGESKIQHINLKAGWNWISFNIKPNKPSTGISGVILNDYKFTDGDVIKSDGVVNMYSSGKWFRSTMTFNHLHSYMIYVHNGGMLSIIGTKLELSELAIPIKANWNFLPYLCTETMSVTDAMSAYYDEGTPGDVIKSYDEFAVMTSDHKWVGSLTHMRPGVGYMIQKHKSGQFDFRYPARPMGSDSSTEDDVTVNDYVASEIDQENFTSSAMPVLATVLDENGEGAKEGDILKAYDGDALVGTAVADNEGRFFLMTHAEDGQEIRFTLSGNGRMDEIATKPILRFNASAVIGTYGTPYVIDFNATDEDNAVVYDLEGRRVNNTQNGNIYIKNNKKVIK